MERQEINLANLPYLEEVYTRYQLHPQSVNASWYPFFEDAEHENVPESVTKEAVSPELRIAHLIETYRIYGHLLAKVNPIAINKKEEPWQLKLANLGFEQNELTQLFPTNGLLSQEQATLEEIIATLRAIYCGNSGIEYMGLNNPKMEKWIQEKIESSRFKPKLSIEQKKMILEQLNRSELFESFIHTRYTGQKRFSLEGGETLIPMLESLIEIGSQLDIEEVVLGMAHRGRLNVLSNIMKKSHTDIFSEFEENYVPNSFEGSGDVKYHKGFSSEVTLPNGKLMRIALAPNPSHLESVDPVVEGQTKAKQNILRDSDQRRVVPILIHGDAALAGQGVVYETMQFCNLEGYSTGGTVHFVINNQVGFTTTPQESRSTAYCTDIAKTFNAPVFHVNAEDPEGCVYATNLAIELRQKFHCDVFIDLNCYRKYGHNETDEPAYTQPLEYHIIRKKVSIRKIYHDQLEKEGILEKELADALEQEFVKGMHRAMEEARTVTEHPRHPEKKEETEKDLFKDFNTAVTQDKLIHIAERLSYIPEGFHIHPKLQHLLQERLSMVVQEKRPLDWGMAELLAYGTLVCEMVPIRLSGQDSARGTFSHRHAIWKDQTSGNTYCPLDHLQDKQASFDVFNSSLSEYAVLGFDLGYNLANPHALVIWEAQFGDFCNGAQVIIDQYLATAEQKWSQKSSLVLFLPHGYEGQGPEHSSARMERFLSLCGEQNMRIVNPTTPAQFFHLLRRQAINPVKKPLIVFTPKGLLRHPESTSPLQDLTKETFQELIDDPKGNVKAQRLLLCTGRVYFDLIAQREKRGLQEQIAIVRIEQLYPLNIDKILEIFDKYKHISQCFWVQEEPSNMGAWGYIAPLLQSLIPTNWEFRYVGRQRSASPATGSHALHKKQFEDIMNVTFGEKKHKSGGHQSKGTHK